MKRRRCRHPTAGQIGKRCRELRLDRGLSLRDVATVVGFNPSMLCRMEAGSREARVHELLALAKIYNASLAYIVGISTQ